MLKLQYSAYLCKVQCHFDLTGGMGCAILIDVITYTEQQTESNMPRQKEKSETVVTISGKNYTLLGYESDEYMQRVASYVNSRLEEYRREDSYRRLPADTQNVLVLLNIADEYFKSRVQLEQLTEDLEKRDKDLYDVKHRLVQAASKLEALEATMQEMKDDMAEKDKKIVKLETELAHSSGERASHPAKGNARKA